MACRRGALLLSAVLLAVGPGWVMYKSRTYVHLNFLIQPALSAFAGRLGGGGEEYEIRFVDNQDKWLQLCGFSIEERDQIARQWLTLASEEVLPFRSTQYFTGKCLGFPQFLEITIGADFVPRPQLLPA
ncbi:hypothetical protein AK812_SmicGene7955 [Symbiodinium microadriaticum]|uniref:Uncharacterized protein n=1 Tax=Symbiodinium microadriaticum TaxID=2951 RepID=A0A1Q9EMD4_SYMMI|nr:hypothetical protein AK812_SmicGene7955 [Symbiodinium microadriaticum]